MEEKKLSFAVYQSSTTNKYYIKQEGKEEREISKYEYDSLIEQKEKTLKQKLKK